MQYRQFVYDTPIYILHNSMQAYSDPGIHIIISIGGHMCASFENRDSCTAVIGTAWYSVETQTNCAYQFLVELVPGSRLSAQCTRLTLQRTHAEEE